MSFVLARSQGEITENRWEIDGDLTANGVVSAFCLYEQ